MLLPRITSLLLAVGAASAYKNASPFFILSSEPIPEDAPIRRASIALGEDIATRLEKFISPCDKKFFYIVHQDYVTAEHLRNGSMPKLQQSLSGVVDDAKFLGIPDVVDDGFLNSRTISKYIDETCDRDTEDWGQDETRELKHIQLIWDTLDWERQSGPYDWAADQKAYNADADGTLAVWVERVLNAESPSVLIYTSTPPPVTSDTAKEHGQYEMDDPFPSAPRTDLKRDLMHHERASDDEDMQKGLPLFERYQFLSPPIFMGLTVSIVLLAILSVGLRAISGLEVSYAAFNKEMGPQAQKKQQQ